jgi:hypothetical protein
MCAWLAWRADASLFQKLVGADRKLTEKLQQQDCLRCEHHRHAAQIANCRRVLVQARSPACPGYHLAPPLGAVAPRLNELGPDVAAQLATERVMDTLEDGSRHGSRNVVPRGTLAPAQEEA